MKKGQKIVMFIECYNPQHETFITALHFMEVIRVYKRCFTVDGVRGLKFSLETSNPYRQLCQLNGSSMILAFDDFEKAIAWLEAFKAHSSPSAAARAEDFILKIRKVKTA